MNTVGGMNHKTTGMSQKKRYQEAVPLVLQHPGVGVHTAKCQQPDVMKTHDGRGREAAASPRWGGGGGHQCVRVCTR